MDPTVSNPNRRFTDSVEKAATVLGPATRVRGELTAGEPVEIRGTLEGDSRVSSHCAVSEGARVVGSIDAESLLVAGQVDGRALTAEKIEISASGRVHANLKARVVAIADGAFFEGKVEMEGPDAASGPVTFKEQRQRTNDEPPRR